MIRSLRTVIGAAILLASAMGCMMPPSPADKVTEAARELNLAARFGRLDVASERTAAAARKTFLERRRQWGSELRVVDIDLGGLNMIDKEHAEVLINVSWMRMAEGVLRTTVVKQDWSNEKDGWLLEREKRVSGDLGLFGEHVPVSTAPPSQDVQFPSKTIH